MGTLARCVDDFSQRAKVQGRLPAEWDGFMSKRNEDREETDPEDKLVREIVGSWAEEKHQRLRKYVDICRAARKKFDRSGTTFIDLYCGPGRARIENTQVVLDGSAILAATVAIEGGSPFSQIHIGDADEAKLHACKTRLVCRDITNFYWHLGTSEETVRKIVPSLHRSGLHLAFLDPYSLGALPFTVIETLAQLPRMDMMIHFSTMDLQRNFDRMARDGTLEAVAPGWQKKVDLNARLDIQRVQFFHHWCSLIGGLGYKIRENFEKVTGNKNQPLYLLVMASRSDLGDKFWNEICEVTKQRSLL
jgi:three-Cys-motif partner protein